jgi:hypothetical protein
MFRPRRSPHRPDRDFVERNLPQVEVHRPRGDAELLPRATGLLYTLRCLSTVFGRDHLAFYDLTVGYLNERELTMPSFSANAALLGCV